MIRRVIGISLAIVLGLVVLGTMSNQPTTTPTRQVSPAGAAAIARLEKEEALNRIKLDWTWRKGGFGTVAVATFTVVNGNDFAIKDLAITCRFEGNSGTEIGRGSATLY
jgi:DNA-binding transcriptional regulator YdaS (Cro superfamily)